MQFLDFFFRIIIEVKKAFKQNLIKFHNGSFNTIFFVSAILFILCILCH